MPSGLDRNLALASKKVPFLTGPFSYHQSVCVQYMHLCKIKISLVTNSSLMKNEQVFQLSSALAMIAWLFVIILPRWRWTGRIVLGFIITLFCLIYIFTLSKSFKASDFESFGTLAGVMQLFTSEGAVLAGWIHYLAFDLMVGLFILHQAKKNDIRHWFIIPCLLFTFMLGPVGLLLFLLIRFIKTKQYFADYPSTAK